MTAADCRCGMVKVGGKPTGNRNWNPDCGEHGVMSAWWNDPERVAQREADSIRLRDLQLEAARRRAEGRGPGR